MLGGDGEIGAREGAIEKKAKMKKEKDDIRLEILTTHLLENSAKQNGTEAEEGKNTKVQICAEIAWA